MTPFSNISLIDAVKILLLFITSTESIGNLTADELKR